MFPTVHIARDDPFWIGWVRGWGGGGENCGRVWHGARGLQAVRETTELLLVGVTDRSTATHRTENIKHFEQRVVNECTVRSLLE